MIGLLMLAAAGTIVPADNDDRHFVTGNGLMKLCAANPAPVCRGYIAGVSDFLMMAQTSSAIPKKYCLPANTTTVQLSDVVVNWLKAHPDVRTAGASGLVAGALVEAFPCPEGK